MANKKDYYQLLGLSKDASQNEIKKAFRNLAREHHPDVNDSNKEAEAKFKEINEAYQILSDPEKRQVYDRYGHEGFTQNGGGGVNFGGFEDFGGIGDIFDMFFGGGQRSSANQGPRPERGADLRFDLELTLEEAYTGVQKPIKISRLEKCDNCSGSGAEPGSKKNVCVMCAGAGQVRSQQQTIFGTQVRVGVCPRCHGEGKIFENPCKTCSGGGQVRKTAEKPVDIPAGVDSGMRVRVAGEGDSGTLGGPNGDLYIFTHVKEHPMFRRKGNDLWCEVTIGFPLASLGGEIEVLTIDEKHKTTIHAGIQSGEVIKVRGKGMPDPRSGSKGDFNIIVKVKTPTKLNHEQKELVKKLAESLGDEIHQPQGKSFFENVKRMFE